MQYCTQYCKQYCVKYCTVCSSVPELHAPPVLEEDAFRGLDLPPEVDQDALEGVVEPQTLEHQLCSGAPNGRGLEDVVLLSVNDAPGEQAPRQTTGEKHIGQERERGGMHHSKRAGCGNVSCAMRLGGQAGTTNREGGMKETVHVGQAPHVWGRKAKYIMHLSRVCILRSLSCMMPFFPSSFLSFFPRPAVQCYIYSK